MEIERKYLTKEIPFDLTNLDKTEIEQYYISTEPVIRIRKCDNKFTLTVKGKGHVSRQEFELLITKKQYNSLIKKAETEPISKTRYFLHIQNSLTAEIDVYHNKLEGLITTEVEFLSTEDFNSFTPPYWFGKDISYDKRYKNSNIALNGIPDDIH